MEQNALPRVNFTSLDYAVESEEACRASFEYQTSRHEWNWRMFDGDAYFQWSDRQSTLDRCLRLLIGRGFLWAQDVYDAARNKGYASELGYL